MADTAKPDFTRGVALQALPEGRMVAGTAADEDIVVLRRGETVFAFGAYCTHYHGSLAEGLVDGDSVRCPLHHACFSIRTGEALRAPALDAIPCWRVERQGNTVFVREKLGAKDGKAPPVPAAAATAARHGRTAPAPGSPPQSVVIVGGGAAGLAAADMLRREGYDGAVTMISADSSPPCDRPNLSKDFLAGTAPDEWIPLRSADYYPQQRIELLLDSRVTSLDLERRRLRTDNGPERPFGALLLATGADPVRLEIPGAADSQVFYLRSFADSRAIIAQATGAKRVVVIGASFIGLEVAASMRERGLEVHVVGPETVPMLHTLGAEAGKFIQQLHESHGVQFHLGTTVQQVSGTRVTLSDATSISADFLIVGVGVRPSIGLATEAGLATDRGVAVSEFLQTSAPGIYAAGDIARWPDARTGERIRVEHWVVAQRQGQVAARNMLGAGEKFTAVPYFWCHYYDAEIRYLGHAASWDEVRIEGSLAARDCAITYLRSGQRLAIATLGRDLENLRTEVELEAGRLQ